MIIVRIKAEAEPAERKKSPEQKLLLALLSRAICDVLIDDSWQVEWTERIGARRWMFWERSARPFSFIWVVEGLGLDVEGLRSFMWRACRDKKLAEQVLTALARNQPCQKIAGRERARVSACERQQKRRREEREREADGSFNQRASL